jgi:hypothetical protein
MTNGIGNNFSHQPYGGMTMSTMPCLIMNKKEKVYAIHATEHNPNGILRKLAISVI